ncbi:hypothetical protein [Streptomyces sp. NPDC093808]|uniref:hypothetical protein n=1 Tax=Streptomyces sp. NPDC093808 TaxID=3154985 RepID=UPI00344C46E3
MTAVHGQPATVGDVTVVPAADVAEAGSGVVGGAGHEADAARTAGDGGGDGATGARPVGHSGIRDGTATRRPVRGPWYGVAPPLPVLVPANALPEVIHDCGDGDGLGEGAGSRAPHRR